MTLAREPVLYEGALAKRGQPYDEDYLVIEAGEEVGIKVEITLVIDSHRLTVLARSHSYAFPDA
ncbi:hypothetical protein [Shewanella sediminis]|uniref:hypothetical protein n=1 Tax=Shewanella sediminis TaxID=271097 RepID=UPI0012325DD4|nr:hypothetical protein [Shewanella sediminis]